jgi:hypothetical protein
MIHFESTAIISFIQYFKNNFAIAIPAAQTQLTTTFISSFFFQVIFNQFISQARQTIAVPCWSS